jgi:hypothetical protein
VTTFKRHPEADERIGSATSLVKLILANRTPEMLSKHYRELLRILLWKITEAETEKHETRFQSQGALDVGKNGTLRHEHVYQCSQMIDKLLSAEPGAIDGILSMAIGCTVTLEEHTRLNKFDNYYGWERYKRAGILVKNIETGSPAY